jgi:4-amino-4-deoxyprephenate dehydrogenase
MIADGSVGRCVVIGAGAVGTLFARQLAQSGHHVCVVDTKPVPASDDPRVRHWQGDITDISPRLAAALGRADLVLLAVPEQVALAALAALGAKLADGALLVDTLSAKRGIAAAVRVAAPHVQMVSLNPMFRPSLGIAGRPVAAVVIRDGRRARDLLRLIGRWGGRVVPMTAAEHDRVTAAAQALTHAAVLAFGLALADLGVGIETLTAVAPPPHRAMLALLSRIVAGTPEVYWDVQSANPRAADARDALAANLRRLAFVVERGDQHEFAADLARMRGFLGPELERYRDTCERVLEAATGVPVTANRQRTE